MSGERRWRPPVVAALLSVATLTVLLATAEQIGFARDEGFYFHAARTYQGWFDLLFEDPGRALQPGQIDRFWRYNNEHPALMKTLFGFSDRWLGDGLELLSPSTALRLPGMLAAVGCVALIFWWGARWLGVTAGVFAAVAFIAMPRVFYHAHLCCFDVPITFFWLAVVYLYWRSLDSWRHGLAAGAVFGLALAVKLNAFFLPFVLGLHYLLLLGHWRMRGGRARGERAPRPWAFAFGAVLAPPIFLGHWPWLWHDTARRLLDYVGFHSGHSHYNTAWFGENVIQAPTPILLPAGMTALTVPTTILLLALVGAALRLRRHLPGAPDPTAGEPRREGRGLDLLLLLAGGFPILLISLPWVPVFGGTKHWMPTMPFLALLAAFGMTRLTAAAARLFTSAPPRPLAILVAAFLLLPSVQQTATSHPFGLASYVPLAGGAPGAASLGMTRQFWGYTTMGILPWLNDTAPPNAGVHFHDTASPSVAMFREEGQLRRDIRSTPLKQSEFALLHHELHMIRNEAWVWNFYKTHIPAHVLTYQGVPLVSVYRKPKGAR